MNAQAELIQDQPRVIEDVPGSELNSLLADLAANGAWVYSMTVKGAHYTLTIGWNSQDSLKADKITTHGDQDI